MPTNVVELSCARPGTGTRTTKGAAAMAAAFAAMAGVSAVVVVVVAVAAGRTLREANSRRGAH